MMTEPIKPVEKFLVEAGRKLAELRRKKGYSSYETFALDFDLPRVHYWRLEKGKANFTIRTLMRILDIHGVTLDEFFRMEAPAPKARKYKASA